MKLEADRNLNHNKISFQAYLKFKSSNKNINSLKKAVIKSDKNIILINHRIKDQNNASIELLSGSQFNKFIELLGNTYFRDLRTKLSKFIGEKPKNASVKKYIKKLNKKA